MSDSYSESPKAMTHIREQIQSGNISWTWPIILVFTRLFLAILAQGLTAGIFALQNHSDPWAAAAPWWIVYGTIIDLGCLGFLVCLTRKEGIRLFDLINFKRQKLGRDLLLAFGLIFLFVILIVIGGGVTGKLIYGSGPVPAIMVPLPFLGSLYALLVWPIIWGIAEEMTYMGYALPRLEVLSGKGWVAILIVAFGWAIQHSAMPLLWDWQWAGYRFGSSLLVGIVLPIIYLKTRRLLPFIMAHWVANALSVRLTVIQPIQS
jgi:membrane protease YdiL (CAAX protease family)